MLMDKSKLDRLRELMCTIWEYKFVKDLINNFASSKLALSGSILAHDLTWASYFLDKAKDVISPNYAITKDDLTRFRKQTTGSQILDFHYDKIHFQMVDLGGQPHERVEWKKHYKGTIAVLFMIPLTGSYYTCY